MTTDSGIRASDADREDVVEILGDAFAAGRLTLDEFHERSAAAFGGRTWGDLRALTADLPAGAALQHALHLPAARQGAAAGPAVTGQPGEGPAVPGLPRLLPVMPLVLVWLAVTFSSRDPAALIPVVFLMLVGLRCTAGLRRRPERPAPARRPGGTSPQPGHTLPRI